ncbi:MAG: TonB-dependent receptor [Bacteroidia bacterium]
MPYMFQRSFLFVCFLLIFSDATAQTIPQDTVPANDTISVNIREIVISAGYLAGPNTPVAFHDVSVVDLDNKNAGQEPSFLLSETPAITVYSDAGSAYGYAYFRLRGIDQTRINMTLDGVPLNEPEDQGVYFSNYPDFLNSVGKIQIQRGIGTSKNGSASYGGSLAFSSPDLNDSSQTVIGLTLGSFNMYRMFAEHNSGIKNGKGLYVRGSFLHADGYKERSAHTSGSLFYSAGKYGEKYSLKLTGFAGQQRNELAWLGVSLDIINRNPRTNGNANENDQFTQSLTQLQHIWSPTRRSTFRSSLFYNYLRGNYDFDYLNFLGEPSTEELYNYAFESHFGGFFSNYTFESGNFLWTTGLQVNQYARTHTGSEKSLGELYKNTGYKKDFSAFSKVAYSFRKFVVYGDVQGRSTRFDYKGSVAFPGISWQFLNPKAGIIWNAGPHVSFYYSLGRTGREPTRNDMFAGSDDLMADSLGNYIAGITNPEFVTDHELGLRFSRGRLKASLNLYYMDFENEIVLVGEFGPNGLALSNNVDQSIRTGIEADIEWRLLQWLKMTGNISLNRSLILEQAIQFVPVLTPRLIVNQEWVYVGKRFEAGVSGRYQSTSFIDFANQNEVDGYFLLNCRATFSLKQWSFTLLVNNLTNTRYFNSGYIDVVGTPRYFVQAPANVAGMIRFSL